MTSTRTPHPVSSLLFVLISIGPVPVMAYEVDTHEAISIEAARRSTVDQTLRELLGVEQGLDTIVENKALVDWIGSGSIREDDWFADVFARFRNHFHNPLLQWDEAGLRMPYPYSGVQTGESSVLWSQETGQSWSWPNIRRYFYKALTEPAKSDRNKALAETFRGLGHLIHLIQDAAVPAHARIDPHLAYTFESFVQEVQSSRDSAEQAFFLALLSNPQGPDPGWRLLDPNPLAPIPIARLLDADRYTGGNPNATTEPLVGLAEYSNANFLSEDRGLRESTIPESAQFPFPARSSVREDRFEIQLPTGERVLRWYYEKVADGDAGYRLGTVGFLRDYLVRYNLDADGAEKPGLDEVVYRDYAERLLPRAVGYSIALLDYFFRPRFEARVTSDSGPYSDIKVRFANLVPDEAMRGLVETYAIFDDQQRPLNVTFEVDLAPGAESLATYPMPIAGPWPFCVHGECDNNTADLRIYHERCVVVFRGRLGNEPDAMAIAPVPCAYEPPVFDPCPVTICID